MKQLHKYVLFNFLSILLFSVIFLVLLFFLSDFFGHLSSFLENSVGVYVVAEYYFYYMPFILYYLFPLIFALSSLITLGFMSMRNEIIVMRASGINIFRISYPIIVLSVFFSILMFLSNEFIVNKSLDKAYFIKTFEFSKSNIANIWVKKGNLFINAKHFNADKNTASDITVFKVVNDEIKNVIYAARMRITKNSVVLNDVNIKSMKNLPQTKKVKNMVMNIKINKDDLVKSPQKNDYDTKQVLSMIKKAKDKYFYLALFMSKVFYPLSTIVLTLLSFVFVLKITPRKSDFIKNVFFGGIAFIVYIGLFELLVSMGKMSMIQPVLTIAVFMLLWLSISVYNLLKLGI